MHRALRYGLVALVAVALLSVAAHEAMARFGPVDPERCGSAELRVVPVEDDVTLDEDVDVRAYDHLTLEERRAFDRARGRSEPVAVDPSLLVDSNLTATFTVDGYSYPVTAVVRRDGERYRSRPYFDDCPEVALLPRQANVLFYLFEAIYRVFSPLYLPGVAVLAVVVGYRYVDDRLRFG